MERQRVMKSEHRDEERKLVLYMNFGTFSRPTNLHEFFEISYVDKRGVECVGV